MANRPLFTNEAALNGGNAVGLSIADVALSPPTVGKVRLADQTLVPDVGTTKADLVAAETTLTGYPVGGYDLTGFAGATFSPGGGSVITSNLINVAYASGPSVQIGSYWVEDHAGLVREVYVYDPPITLAKVGDGFPVVVQLGYGANA